MKLFFCTTDDQNACNFYRGKGAYGFLPNTTLCEATKSVDWSSLIGNDLGLVLRPSTPALFSLFRLLGLQMPVIVDWDDDVFQIARDNPAFEHFRTAATIKGIRDTLDCADHITVSTAYLAETWGAMLGHQRISVIPNAHNDYILGRERNDRPRRKVVLWRGAGSHMRDLAEYGDALARVALKHPDWTVVFLGTYPWVLEGKLPCYHVSPKDLMVYFQWLKHGADHAIQIVPLSDTAFNRAKSNIAWLEGSYAGAAVLAPDWEAWRLPGVAHYRDPDTFGEMLEELICNPGLVRDCADSSWRYITDHLLLSHINPQRAALLEQLAARTRRGLIIPVEAEA
jgi:glycosyltransferase involved in cell wall biosynthesis